MITTMNVKKMVAEGVALAKNWEIRNDVIQAQRATHLNKLSLQSAELGISVADALGAQAVSGVKNLDELPTQALDDAVAAARAIRRKNVAIVSLGPPSKFDGHSTMGAELELRGVDVSYLNVRKMHIKGKKLLYEGPKDGDPWRELPMPDAVISRGAGSKKLGHLERAGVHFVNLPSTRHVTTSKSTQAEIFAANNISHPRTIPNLMSADEVKEEVAKMGFPSVVKKANGYGGKAVWVVKTPGQLDEVAAKHFPNNGERHNLLVQQYVDVGSADNRFQVVRQVDGSAQVASVHHRQGVNGIANGPEGSVYTRIPLRDVDPEAADIARRATDAIGLDYAGVDMVKASDGKWYVLEINGTPGVPEHDVPLPRVEHTVPQLADWAVYGQSRKQ